MKLLPTVIGLILGSGVLFSGFFFPSLFKQEVSPFWFDAVEKCGSLLGRASLCGDNMRSLYGPAPEPQLATSTWNRIFESKHLLGIINIADETLFQDLQGEHGELLSFLVSAEALQD